MRSLDGTRTQAFYVAHAGLEKLTADLGDLFAANFAPTGAQINALTTTPPSLGVTWLQPDGTDGYRITFPDRRRGQPAASTMTVTSGPFQGLVGLATPYQMTSPAGWPDRIGGEPDAHAADGRDSRVSVRHLLRERPQLLRRSELQLRRPRALATRTSILASGDGSTLTLSDRVTAVGEIIRTNLSNGWDTTTNYNGTVSVITAPGAFRALARTEGSLVGTLGSATNEPTWTNLSTGTYNHNITNGRTGAQAARPADHEVRRARRSI